MGTFSLSDTQILQSAGWAILHSTWQFTLIALIMTFLLKYYQNEKSFIRYYIALGSIIIALFSFCLTFLFYWYEGQDITQWYVQVEVSHLSQDKALVSFWNIVNGWLAEYQEPIVYTWMIGVGLFMLRLIISLGYVEYLAHKSKSISHQAIFLSFSHIASQYGISRMIELRESNHIHTPMILGLIKPVILFPIGMINQLDIKETEAILAHELAHFVRNDIWVNVLQTVIEALLYYHPAIWWISTNIRVERENCCDEMAVNYIGNNLLYAKTLVKIQELSQTSPSLALNFSQKNSFFSNRIKKILNMAQTRNFLKERIITSVVLVFLVMLFAKNLNGLHNDSNKEEADANIKKEVFINVHNDSIPNKKESIRIERKSKERDVKISMEDGEVTELQVDGKVIDKADFDKYRDIIDESKPMHLLEADDKMFFFDNDGDWTIQLNDALRNQDSILKNFNFNFEGDLSKMGFDKAKLEEQMTKLKEDLGKMKFDFKGLDSMNFSFVMPHFDSVQIYDFDDEDLQRFRSKKAFPHRFEFPDMDNGDVTDALGDALNRDGFLIPNEQNKVELTGKYLKINGEKQPDNIFRKYKRIFESESGIALERNSKIHFNFEGKESKRKYRTY